MSWPTNATIVANNIYKHMKAKSISNEAVAKSLNWSSFSYEEILKKYILLKESDYVKLANLLGTTVDKIKYNEVIYDDRRWG